jgi:hypothetical protein
LGAQFYDPHNAIVLHHNHPSNNTLSVQDISMLAAPGAHSIWAHGHDGAVYRAALTDFSRSLMGANHGANVRALGNMRQRIASEVFLPPMQHFVDGGVLTTKQGNQLTGHLANEALRLAGIIDYQHNQNFEDDIKRLGLQPWLISMKLRIARICRVHARDS